MNQVEAYDIPLNAEGRVYHLDLLPQDIADTVILVGDPGRVNLIASLLDSVRVQRSHREFHTVTGSFQGREFTVMSTGIGTDNIDIVLHELDALVNLDLETKQAKEQLTSLRLLRIGTCGLVQPESDPSVPVLSHFAIGLDNLAHFYKCDIDVNLQYFQDHLSPLFPDHVTPYVRRGDAGMLEALSEFSRPGITMTAPGFYGPQGRPSRAKGLRNSVSEALLNFQYQGILIENFEMECSALYMHSDQLGHRAATICLGIAKRQEGDFKPDYQEDMRKLSSSCLAALT